MYIKVLLKKTILVYSTVSFISGSALGSLVGLYELNKLDDEISIVLNKPYLKPFQPIVNFTLESKKVISYISYYGISYGVVALTAPISIPLIIYFDK